LLRASDETTVTLPVRGVWLRVQFSAAMPETETETESSTEREEKRGTRKWERGTG